MRPKTQGSKELNDGAAAGKPKYQSLDALYLELQYLELCTLFFARLLKSSSYPENKASQSTKHKVHIKLCNLRKAADSLYAACSNAVRIAAADCQRWFGSFANARSMIWQIGSGT